MHTATIRSLLRCCVGRAATVPVVAIALAGLLAGCGGALTKRDFSARADAICATTLRQIRAVPPPSFSGGSAQRLSSMAGYLSRVEPLVKSEAAQIRHLPRPGGSDRQRQALARYLSALTLAADEYGAMAVASRRHAANAVAEAETALAANPLTSLAAGYGLGSCTGAGPTV